MNVKEAIEKRRAYRSLESVDITEEIITELAEAASLMCSCFNNQPWRYVFTHTEPKLTEMKNQALQEGNKPWCSAASMMITVFSKEDLDCVIGERKYYQFDTGMATGAMILRATELGLVAHPIAGFIPDKVKEVLGIPEEFFIITMVIVGKKKNSIPDFFSDFQKEAEQKRPERKKFNEIVYRNVFE